MKVDITKTYEDEGGTYKYIKWYFEPESPEPVISEEIKKYNELFDLVKDMLESEVFPDGYIFTYENLHPSWQSIFQIKKDGQLKIFNRSIYGDDSIVIDVGTYTFNIYRIKPNQHEQLIDEWSSILNIIIDQLYKTPIS